MKKRPSLRLFWRTTSESEERDFSREEMDFSILYKSSSTVICSWASPCCCVARARTPVAAPVAPKPRSIAMVMPVITCHLWNRLGSSNKWYTSSSWRYRTLGTIKTWTQKLAELSNLSRSTHGLTPDRWHTHIPDAAGITHWNFPPLSLTNSRRHCPSALPRLHCQSTRLGL